MLPSSTGMCDHRSACNMSSRKRQQEDVEGEMKKKLIVNKNAAPRHHGLINQGATCYLNSVLQVLFMTSEIHDKLDQKSTKTDRELRNIFEKLRKTTCGTIKITETLDINDVSQQRDAADCLELILRNVSGQVSEVFKGQLMYTTTCFSGHTINNETNPFWTLPLSLRVNRGGSYSVARGFEKMFQTKSYRGDNMLYCETCEKKRKAEIRCEMVKLPHILILLLKRFDFDYHTMSDFKSDCSVSVPSELNVKKRKYKIYGIVNHMGSLRRGHYTATVLSTEDHTWYNCDDSHVTMMGEQPFGETTNNSRTAYLLMYREHPKTTTCFKGHNINEETEPFCLLRHNQVETNSTETGFKEIRTTPCSGDNNVGKKTGTKTEAKTMGEQPFGETTNNHSRVAYVKKRERTRMATIV